jgi:ribose transport system substrate-binding protein
MTQRLGWTAFFAACFLTALTGANCRADEASDGLARAEAVIAEHRQTPVFTPPGEAFDIRACAKGKKMLSMPSTSSNQFLKGIIAREIAIGDRIGLKVMEWQAQGRPSEWSQGIDYAISNKFDIIDLISSINPAALEPQIKAAKAAGVKVFASHFYDPSQPPNPLLDGSLAVSFHDMGFVGGNWMIAATKGAAKIIIVESDDVPPTAPLVDGIKEAFSKNCPGCKILQQINVANAEWGTKIQPAVQAALIAHPDANYVIPVYDSMSQFAIPAIQITGRAATVKVVSTNGTPFVLDLIRQGKVEMDSGESLDWIARATIDGYLRSMCGLPMPKMIGVPLFIFDKSNAETAGIPAESDKGYGDLYIKGYDQLWKLN